MKTVDASIFYTNAFVVKDEGIANPMYSTKVSIAGKIE